MNQAVQLASSTCLDSPNVEQSATGHWRVAGSRVLLDSIVHACREGESTEQIYGSITFYLAHQQEIDENLEQQSDRWNRLQKESQQRNAALRERIRTRQTTAAVEDVAT